ncbi:MAG: hypothetical protein JHC78_03830 [Ilumatobacteraceae bacterium]|nr:hypothetical protein [Ilumatobacteraceae bacterium]
MAAPQYSPSPAVDTTRIYGSPQHVAPSWTSDRPAEITGQQPTGEHLGYQGPNQGYVLTLASHLRSKVVVTKNERVEDVLRGCTLIALRRASLFGRAPVVHDLTLALTIWGFLSADVPADLVATRTELFSGVDNVLHHYSQGRTLADMVPDSTLRLSVQLVTAQMPMSWRALTGA